MMRNMINSGVSWIGFIPDNWKVDSPKWHFEQRKDRAYAGVIQLTASQKYGVISQEEYMEKTGAKIVTVQKDFDILKLVCAGDFVIHMRSFQGGLEYSERTGSTSSAYVMLIPKDTILEPKYYRWFFKAGLIRVMDDKCNSADLAIALKGNTKIIATTIQKFPYIVDSVAGLKKKNFAVIIDEAHSSTAGKDMAAVTQSLGAGEQEAADVEDIISDEIKSNGKQANVSIFAFTATPKPP